MEVTHEEMF